MENNQQKSATEKSQDERIEIVEIETRSTSSADAAIEASRAAAQKRLSNIIKLGAGVIALMLVIYLGWQYVSSSDHNLPDDEPATGTVSIDTASTLSESELKELRIELISALDNLETSIAQLKNNPDYQRWDAKQISALSAEKDRVLSMFARGAFSSAKESLDALNNSIDAYENTFASTYQNYIDEAKSAFEQGDINNAKLAFSKASALSPSNAENESIKPRLLNFDGVASIRARIAVAQTENNLSTQLSLLEQLDMMNEATPNDLQVIEDLRKQIKTADLTATLADARAAIERNDLESAKSLLLKARNIDAKNSGVSVLANELDAIIKANQQKALLADVRSEIEADNWRSVGEISRKASQLFPQNTAFRIHAEKANKIIAAQQNINGLIGAPQRLADAGVREYAIGELKKALPLAADSSSLASTLFTLDSELRKYQTSVPVVVNSDSASFVSVIGVGNVGVVESKEISLTPGIYTFEAKRNGFKTKRLEVEVTLSGTNSLTIAATEEL